MDCEAALREVLGDRGLAHHDAVLLAAAEPSVRLRGLGEPQNAAQVFPQRARVMTGPEGAVAIASGDYSFMVLLNDGSVRAWGTNSAGQLGDGTRVNRSAPVTVRGLEGVSAIAAGAGGHSLALTHDGRLFAWGWNGSGALGDGTTQSRRSPVQVIDGGVVAIAAGARSSLALLDDGTVMAWGESVVPGYRYSTNLATRPVAVDGLRSIVAITAGQFHFLALCADGHVFGWGLNARGEIGDGTQVRRESPVAVRGLKDVAAIAAGWDHSLALKTDGTVHAWGHSGFGAVHRWRDQLVPLPVAGLGPVAAIAAGTNLSLAIVPGRGAFAWGRNFEGQLGDPSDPTGEISREVPGPVAGAGARIVAIAPRLALRDDGGVLTWGGVTGSSGPEDDHDLPVGASRLGGSPDLPAREAWPLADGRPMAFLAQIALVDIAPFDERSLLPAEGTLSFFWSLADFDAPGSVRVLHHDCAADLSPRPTPGEFSDVERFEVLPVHPARELTLPPADEATFNALGLSKAEQPAYRDLVEADDGPRHRMLGHPDVIQNDPRFGDAQLLLQLDTDEAAGMDWGEGRLYFWMQTSDLRAGAFDRVWLDYQQT